MLKLRGDIRSCLLLVTVFSALQGCSQLAQIRDSLVNAKQQGHYLQTGTIIVSLEVPSKSDFTQIDAGREQKIAALLGYIPPTTGFVPAENEAWLEINKQTRAVSIFKGKELVRELKGEGVVTADPGTYALQHKQKMPLWYAPDDYFRKRRLAVPKSGDRLRYRRGALGPYVLYPTTAFPIHSAPLWSEEVGGLRLSQADLSELYYMLPIGANVVVK